MDDLSAASGEQLIYTTSHGWSYKLPPLGNSDTAREHPRIRRWELTGMQTVGSIYPALTRGDILRTSDHPFEFLLRVSQGSGYTQFGGMPLPVRTAFPMSEEDYKRCMSTAWPTLPKRPRAKVQPVTQKEEPKQIDRESQAVAARAFEQLASLFDREHQRQGPIDADETVE